jgi:hypothetical protein
MNRIFLHKTWLSPGSLIYLTLLILLNLPQLVLSCKVSDCRNEMTLLRGMQVTYYKEQPGQCVFPFTYKNVTVNKCVTNDTRGQPWCAITSNYDQDQKWKYCKDEMHCHFPFIYKGTSYTSCIDHDHAGNMWCATTANYDKDKAWKACGVKNCVFPFTYKGESYSSCTTRDHNGKAWCATTSSYEKDHKWKICDANDHLMAGGPKKIRLVIKHIIKAPPDMWLALTAGKNIQVNPGIISPQKVV